MTRVLGSRLQPGAFFYNTKRLTRQHGRKRCGNGHRCGNRCRLPSATSTGLIPTSGLEKPLQKTLRLYHRSHSAAGDSKHKIQVTPAAVGGDAYGQVPQHQVLSVVMDGAGENVPGANAQLENVLTGIREAMVTNETGVLAFPRLNSGVYRLTVEKHASRPASILESRCR